MNNQQQGGTASNITINNSSEKAFELFERIIEEKDIIISQKNQEISKLKVNNKI